MTDPRRQAFADYLRTLADRMGLKDWQVEVDDAPPESPTAYSATWLPYGIKKARVRLGESFLDHSPEEQRATLVHELIHLHFAPATGIADEAMPDGEHRHFNRMMEYGVDAVAEAWAPLLPLRLAPPPPEVRP